MNCPDLKANFEYYDIVVTTNTVDLRRHTDYKDDHRQYYNHCFVYSFSKIVCGIEYKTSLITATRRDTSAVIEQIKRDTYLNNKRKLNSRYN